MMLQFKTLGTIRDEGHLKTMGIIRAERSIQNIRESLVCQNISGLL